MIMTQHVPPTEAGAEALPSSSHETYWVERGVPESLRCVNRRPTTRNILLLYSQHRFFQQVQNRVGFFFQGFQLIFCFSTLKLIHYKKIIMTLHLFLSEQTQQFRWGSNYFLHFSSLSFCIKLCIFSVHFTSEVLYLLDELIFVIHIHLYTNEEHIDTEHVSSSLLCMWNIRAVNMSLFS